MAFQFVNTLANFLFPQSRPGFQQLGPGGRPGLFERAFQDLTTQDLLAGGFATSAALSKIAGGFAEKQAAGTQAEFAELNAGQILTQGRQQSADILQDLERNVSSATVAAAASGVTGGGSVATGIRESIKRGEDVVGAIRDNAVIGQQLEIRRAREIRRQGRDAFRSAISEGAFGVGEAFIKIDERRRDRKERRENA